jgi:chromosome segregation protein
MRPQQYRTATRDRARIEHLRTEHSEALDRQNAVQAEYYTVGVEISRLEQAIEHARETRETLKREQEQLDRTWAESESLWNVDRERLAELERRAGETAPALETERGELARAAAELTAAEAAMQAWQEQWEAETRSAGASAQTREIQSARIAQLELHITQLQERLARLADETAKVDAELKSAGLESARDAAREFDRACTELELRLRDNGGQAQELRAQRDDIDEELSARRGEQQSAQARLASLR